MQSKWIHRRDYFALKFVSIEPLIFRELNPRVFELLRGGKRHTKKVLDVLLPKVLRFAR